MMIQAFCEANLLNIVIKNLTSLSRNLIISLGFKYILFIIISSRSVCVCVCRTEGGDVQESSLLGFDAQK